MFALSIHSKNVLSLTASQLCFTFSPFLGFSEEFLSIKGQSCVHLVPLFWQAISNLVYFITSCVFAIDYCLLVILAGFSL